MIIRNDALPGKFTLYLRRLYYFFTNERFSKKFDYDWHKKSSRFDIINKIIKKKKFESYLEIGCQSDVNFSKIIIKNKIGVDPQSGGTHRMTSDDFFKQNKSTFDLIFIDGLHVYEQVLKDIENSLKVLNDNGVILIHDCLPAKIWHQTIPQTHSSWNGDVWKSIVKSRTRIDIDTYTIEADQGLGLILKRENKDLLVDKIENFKNLKFRDYYIHHKKFMRIIDENDVLEIIN
ncbi:MAG: class I SAM-dependent methyltransferase [Candidatus Pelagibacter sp.]